MRKEAITITPITAADFQRFWPIFQAIVAAEETYAIDPQIGYEAAYALWCQQPQSTWQSTWVASYRGEVLGSYYVKPNAAGPGQHVCNCGYMVAPQARGKGVARAMCLHSQQLAIDSGYLAMQFNAVVATNEAAVHLWQSLGFRIVGTVPHAYRHRRLGLVDTHVMYKALVETED